MERSKRSAGTEVTMCGIAVAFLGWDGFDGVGGNGADLGGGRGADFLGTWHGVGAACLVGRGVVVDLVGGNGACFLGAWQGPVDSVTVSVRVFRATLTTFIAPISLLEIILLSFGCGSG